MIQYCTLEEMAGILSLVCSFLVCGLALSSDTTITSTLSVNMDQAIFRVSEQYLSICLDSHLLTDPSWTIDSFPARAVNMAKALAPAMLRVGGTQGDYLVFNKSISGLAKKVEFQMSPSQWDALNEFTKNVGWDFIFGLNILLNKPNSSLWDPTNAKELFEYTKSKGYKVNWELGNEPTMFYEPLAKDFEILSTILNDTTWIVGPDITDGYQDILLRFLIEVVKEGNFLHAATWHHYYFGNTGTQAMFTDLKIMNSFVTKAGLITLMAKLTGFKGEIWLGETADAFDGGVDGISDSYLGGFLWLDKLGVAAIMRHSRVFRQTFFGGYYGLLTPDFQPTPSYWISVIYKRLVGPQVLEVFVAPINVRVYAHCGLQNPGSVVLIMINLDNSEMVLSLGDPQLQESSRDIYWLTSTELPELTSKGVALGGKPLVLNGDNLPELNPVHQQPNNTITISPLSYGFIVFKEAHASTCTN